MKKIKIGIVLLASLLILTACSSKPSTDKPSTDGKVDLNTILTKVQDTYKDDYVPSMEMDLDTLSNIYGIAQADVESFVGEVPMMSTHVDTFIAIQAKPGKGDAVAIALKSYRTNQIDSGIIYPSNFAKVNASEVVQQGDYVFFIMLGAFDNNDGTDEKAALEFAKEENKKGVDAVNSFFNK